MAFPVIQVGDETSLLASENEVERAYMDARGLSTPKERLAFREYIRLTKVHELLPRVYVVGNELKSRHVEVEWYKSFAKFIEDVGLPPSRNKSSLLRLNPDSGFVAGNVVWGNRFNLLKLPRIKEAALARLSLYARELTEGV